MILQAYILADTTYNSLSVDEVAAAHIQGDCVVRCCIFGLVDVLTMIINNNSDWHAYIAWLLLN